MTDSDRLMESLYVLADRQPNERTRLEVVRCAYLAAQHRAAQLREAPARANHRRGALVASSPTASTGE